MSDCFRVGITRDFLNVIGESALAKVGFEPLLSHPQAEVKFLDRLQPRLIPEQIRDFDALVVLGPALTRESLVGVERLAAVARFGVGYDRIDVAACTEADVALLITPGGVRYPMAEGTVTWILMLSKHALQKDRDMRRGLWKRTLGFCLRGRTLGLVGFGNIAREVVRLLRPFGMRVMAFDPYVPPAQMESLGVEAASLETLLSEADFVSIHCPLNEETRGLIGASQLRRMKSTAYLINTARGPIVEEAALIQALREGWIAGAALDVFEKEPLPSDHPLLTMDNVLLAPHAIGWTEESIRGISTEDCQGILAVMRGEIPEHVVNTKVLQRPGFRRKLQRYREQFGKG